MRIAFASEQARILVTNVLDRILRREGVGEQTLTSLVDQSNKLARRNIIHKSPQLQTLLEEWEAANATGKRGGERQAPQSLMAIVKASFTKSTGGAKASIRYIQHRPGKEGASITRTLFGSDGLMGRYEAYRMIDEAEQGSRFFRFVFSPDPHAGRYPAGLKPPDNNRTNHAALEDRLQQSVSWVGVQHADHAPHRHVHIVAVVKGRLTRTGFSGPQTGSNEACLQQRQERDLVPGATSKGAGGGTMGSGILGRTTLVFQRGLPPDALAVLPRSPLTPVRFPEPMSYTCLLPAYPAADGLLLGRQPARQVVAVVPTQTRRELGNLLDCRANQIGQRTLGNQPTVMPGNIQCHCQ